MKFFRFAVILPLTVIAVAVTTIFMLQTLGSKALFALGNWAMHVMLFLIPLLIIIMLVYHLLNILKKRD